MPQEYDINALLNSAPNSGQEYDVNALLTSAQAPNPNQAPPMQWSDVPLAAARNFPSSVAKMGSDLYSAVTHPIQTAIGLSDIPAGALNRAFPKTIGKLAQTVTPEATARTNATYDQLINAYKEKYGTEEGFKQAIAQDPAGVMADLATVVAPVSGGLRSIGMRPVVGAGKVASSALGLTTGVGEESVARAFKAGAEGDKSFMQNLRGEVPMQDVLDTAKQNLQNLKMQKNAEYKKGMTGVTNDKSVLDFSGIDSALTDAQKMTTYKGQVKNPAGYATYQKMQEAVDNWKKLNPSDFHTPEGFDALKQQLGDIAQSIPYEEKNAKMVANQVYNKVKTTINDQAPTYAKVMGDYSSASELINEIERALSLKDKASADTAMRKLQSLTRNNVNTNYGNRLNLAQQLETQGGSPFINSLAGQSMQSLAPRGLAGVGGLGTLGSALTNPYTLLALPFQSPRVVGTGANLAGRAYGSAGRVFGKVPLRPTQGATLADLLPQLGQEQQ
jgi:hypothetical protein